MEHTEEMLATRSGDPTVDNDGQYQSTIIVRVGMNWIDCSIKNCPPLYGTIVMRNVRLRNNTPVGIKIYRKWYDLVPL